MAYTTLINPTDLAQHLNDPAWVVLDCRFSLADPERGRRDYAHSHIPGAIYLHLNDDLSAPVVPGQTGRHPLPEIAKISGVFSQCGIDSNKQVVAYDDSGGAMAVRAWWLLYWLGHEAAAVLDGGWPQWLKEKHAVTRETTSPEPRSFVPHPRSELVITTDEIFTHLGDTGFKVFDSRNADRYRGENETIDPVAGHLPGAISAPYADNLTPTGRFKSKAELRARFEQLLDNIPVNRASFYCGSGVTAAHNLLALKHVGLGDAKLYPGSWSEWITDRKRPIATGDKP
jgi:thiosulfate/3-mercaptopyruvate sulfurtransferase